MDEGPYLSVPGRGFWTAYGVEALLSQRDRLREALTYYAEGRIWDNGENAREALRNNP